MKVLTYRARILVAALTIFTLAACTGRSKKEEYGLDIKETIRFNIKTEPPSLDWSKSTDTTSAEVQYNIMDGLVLYDIYDPDLKLIPGLATKWESSKDARTWTFTLRQGVKWSDGVEFKAQHVIDGWERLLNPKTASEYAYALFPLKGAQDYNTGKLKDFAQVGVKAKDDYTLVVELNQPMSFFPLLGTHHSTYPIRKDVIDKHGDKWTEPGNIVTLGAYNLKVWDHDKAIVLERNENYWGEKAKVKNILMYMIIEESTMVNLFEAGKLDFVYELPSKDLARLRKMEGFRELSTLVLQYWGFVVNKKPLDDVRVRKAIVHAVNRNEVVQMLGAGEVPLKSWVPKGMFGHEPDIGLDFDLEKAKALLAEAGYGEGKKEFPRITMVFNTNDNHRRIAENIQAQLKKNLGINLEIQNEEWKVYLDRLKTDPPQIFRLGWQADYPDPDNFISLMLSISKNNHTKWKNTAYDKLVAEGASELNQEKRKEIYRKAQKILLEDDVAAMPIYSSVRTYLISPRLKNPPVNALERYWFVKATLE